MVTPIPKSGKMKIGLGRYGGIGNATNICEWKDGYGFR